MFGLTWKFCVPVICAELAFQFARRKKKFFSRKGLSNYMNVKSSITVNFFYFQGRLTCLRWLQFCITQTFANKKEMLRLMCHGVKQSTEVKLGITGQTCQTKPPRSAQVESDSKMNGKDFQRTFQKPKIQLVYDYSNSQNPYFS